LNSYIQKGTPAYWRAISALFLGTLASFGVMYCMQPLIPVFSKEFHLTPSVASLAMSFTTGGMAVSMLVIAGFSGLLDRKLTMTVSLLGSTLFAVAAVFSSDFTTILIFRAIQGILVAGFPAIAMAYINEEFEPGTTGLVIGIYISGTSIGGLSGRLLVSTLTDFFSWKVALLSLGAVSCLISAWFCCALPKSKHFSPEKHIPHHMIGAIMNNLHNKTLLHLYLVAFCIMGSFIAMYNYMSYPLMAPPYNLSQTAVGGLFMLYLVGTFSSTFMGGMADRHGNGKILCLSLGIMLIGGIVTLLPHLIFKILGLAVFTFGFFGSHSTACSWVGKCCLGDKAQAASLYLLFYYIGASVIGTGGGIFLSAYGWEGVIMLIGFVLSGSLLIAAVLMHEAPVVSTSAGKS
jgi:YNFM family putative membrane transporter